MDKATAEDGQLLLDFAIHSRARAEVQRREQLKKLEVAHILVQMHQAGPQPAAERQQLDNSAVYRAGPDPPGNRQVEQAPPRHVPRTVKFVDGLPYHVDANGDGELSRSRTLSQKSQEADGALPTQSVEEEGSMTTRPTSSGRAQPAGEHGGSGRSRGKDNNATGTACYMSRPAIAGPSRRNDSAASTASELTMHPSTESEPPRSSYGRSLMLHRRNRELAEDMDKAEEETLRRPRGGRRSS